MATLEDILAATKVLAENSAGNQNGGACSKTAENRNWVSEEKIDDGNAADTGKRIVEGETVVESILDDNNCLGKTEKEKVGFGNLGSLSTGVKTDSKNKTGVVVGVMRDEKIENGEDSGMDTDQSRDRDSDGDKLGAIERNNSYADVDGCEKEQLNSEKTEDLDHGFCAGDFVWGKIKSHPWWPGRVYDPRDASDFAVKRRQDGHLLVAFFGDGSCSWCLPSQLKPFVENFKEMSVGSNVKSFVNAVQRAVDEIGRLLESKMMCGCVPLEKRDGLAKPPVANAGIKAGVFAPDSQLSVPEYEPTEILERVTELANSGYVDDVFEIEILKSWLSAFHRAKGVYPLPAYSEPFHIEGMEDKNKIMSKVTDDFSVPIEVPILGPLDDDWLASPVCNNTKSQGSSGEKTYHRRKQKSVAELMGGNPNDKPKTREETTTKERKDIGKSTSSKKKQKKRNDGEVDEASTHTISSEETTTKDRKDVGKSTSSNKKKNKKSIDGKVEKVGNQGDSSMETTTKDRKDVGKSTSSNKKKNKKSNGGKAEEVGSQKDSLEETATKEREVDGKSTASGKKKSNESEIMEVGTNGDSSTGKLGRKRKVEASEMPKLATMKVSSAENSGSGDDLSKGISSGKLKKIDVATENTSVETKEETETVSTPRERKKSKYLCPPYTTPSWRTGSSSFKMGTASDKSLNVDNVVEHVTQASADPCPLESVSEFADKSSDEKVAEDHQEALGASVKESPQTQESNQKLTIAASDVNVPVHELVSDIQSAAVDPLYLSKEGCLDMVWSFVSALRSSVYLHGPNYKVHQKCKTGNKRKSLATEQGKQENDTSCEKFKTAEKSIPKENKTQKKLDQSQSKSKSRSKKATEILDGNASSCLVLKFTPGYPLPSKEEIMRLFSKYGSLNERETYVATESHSVYIVYTKDSDAEVVFKSPVKERPFSNKNVVNYSLQKSSGVSKPHASHPKVTPRKRATEGKPDSSRPTSSDDDILTDARVIRQKLDIMTAILENYHSKFSTEDKSGLKQEMRSLLDNVETASEKVRVLAEKSPT